MYLQRVAVRGFPAAADAERARVAPSWAAVVAETFRATHGLHGSRGSMPICVTRPSPLCPIDTSSIIDRRSKPPPAAGVEAAR
jgi:hypothetical protein